MRRSIAAVALIRREREGQAGWLAQWNDAWERYHFVAGHRRPDESFQECLVRELREELGLEAGSDYVPPDQPIAHLEYTAWSERAQAETQYTMVIFRVELIDEARARAIETDPKNRWLTEAEIRGQRCQDARRVSPTMSRVLDEVGWDA